MALLNRFNSPFVRFNLLVAATVLALALSLSQLYAVLNADVPPSVDARLVLDAVQQLRQHQQPLSCSAEQETSCEKALFIVYPPEYWQGQLDAEPGSIIPLTDSQQQTLLCSVEPSGELLCLNQLNWPDPNAASIDLAYVFYFILLLALFLISRNLFRDMAILRHSALQEIRHGKFPHFTLSQRSYLAPLAQSLRNMTVRIEQLNRFQTEMAETVCHDIKTPLARLKFISHLFNANTIEQSRQQITQNLQEIEENVYDYLRLAENNYEDQALNSTLISLDDFLQSLMSPHQDPTQVQLVLICEPQIQWYADSKLLARAVNNLLINALRFAKHQVIIQATLTNQGPAANAVPVNETAFTEMAAKDCGSLRWLCLSISDDGPGWPTQNSPNDVSDANLLKADPASPSLMTADPEDGIIHHGLGLAIVRRVAEKHHGQLRLTQSDQGGACAQLWLSQRSQ